MPNESNGKIWEESNQETRNNLSSITNLSLSLSHHPIFVFTILHICFLLSVFPLLFYFFALRFSRLSSVSRPLFASVVFSVASCVAMVIIIVLIELKTKRRRLTGFFSSAFILPFDNKRNEKESFFNVTYGRNREKTRKWFVCGTIDDCMTIVKMPEENRIDNTLPKVNNEKKETSICLAWEIRDI